MRNFLFILILLPLWAAAENVVQLTGGNYIFAEDGKLIFNIEHSAFENRNWTYSAENDRLKTLFYQRMDFKTLNSSNFHAYEMASVVSDSPYQKAVYNPYYNRGYGTQKVIWPAIWAGAVRVGGWILPRAAARGIAACWANLGCRGFAGSVGINAAALCTFIYSSNSYNVPGGFCERAKEAGFEKNDKGEFKKPAGVQWEVSFFNGPCIGHCGANEKKRFDTHAEAVAFAQKKSEEFVDKFKYVPTCKQGALLFESGRYKGKERAVGCHPFFNQIKPIEFADPQDMTFFDIETLLEKDIKKNPNDYVNDKGQIGKEVRKHIEPTRADIDTKGGTLSVVSDPYRDKTGQTKQDFISVDAPSDWHTPVPGGKADNPTPGASTTVNNTHVTAKSRPDLESESKPSKQNDPNNGKGSVSGGGSNQGGSNQGGSQNGNEGKRCEAGSDSLECAQMGDVDEGQAFQIPGVEDVTTWKPDDFLPRTGVCPAPRTVNLSLFRRSYEFKYDSICSFAQGVRGLIIAMSVLTAGFIMFGRRSA